MRALPGLVAVPVLLAAAAAAGEAAAPGAGAAVTVVAGTPATMVIGRRAGDSEVVLDLDVTAFRPPRHGGVAAVVTLAEDRDGGRQAEAGSFAVFPATTFKATGPADVRPFRIDAAAALTDLGRDTTSVRVTVRLESLTDTSSAAGARLTLGAVRFVAGDDADHDPANDGDPNDPKAGDKADDHGPDQPR